MNTTAATPLTINGQDVLGGVEALQVVVDADAQDGHQQHALGGPEVAAVDARAGHGRPHPGRAVVGQAATGRCRAATLRWIAGPRTTSSTPIPISTGTIASKADEGRTSRSTAPTMPPEHRADARRSRRSRWPISSRR